MTADEILRWGAFLWPILAGAAGAWFGVKEALREARAANRRLDTEVALRVELDKEHAITRTGLEYAQMEIATLRTVRHSVIDTLNGVVQFLANSKESHEESDRLRTRVRELEAGSR